MRTSTCFQPTRHAVERYMERFAGNVTEQEAARRIRSIATSARRKRPAPGGATVYSTHGIELVVAEGRILTLYGVDTRPDTYALEA